MPSVYGSPSPYQIEHETYLRGLENSVAQNRKRPHREDYGTELRRQLSGMLVVGMIVAGVAFILWNALPV